MPLSRQWLSLVAVLSDHTDNTPLFAGHEFCDPDHADMNGILFQGFQHLPESFHPTVMGQQAIEADLRLPSLPDHP